MTFPPGDDPTIRMARECARERWARDRWPKAPGERVRSPIERWLSTYGWIVLIVLLVICAVVLVMFKACEVIAWPWWAVLLPADVLAGLAGWALVGCEKAMRDNGWNR